MKKLYLIRRDTEKIIGPYDAAQVAKGFQKMEFGPTDEISGHLGPWVQIENRGEIRKYYPVFTKNFFAHETTYMTNPKQSPKKAALQKSRKKLPQPKPQSSSKTTLFLILILLIGLAGGGYYFYQNLMGSGRPPTPASLMQLFDQEGAGAVSIRMKPHLDSVLSKYRKDPNTNRAWEPLLRLLAFQEYGAIKGISKDVLSGGNPQPLPKSCSVGSWKKRLSTIATELQDASPTLKLPWIRLLALEPSWVLRRGDQRFLQFVNYHHACVAMALKAGTLMETADFGPGKPLASSWLVVKERLNTIDSALFGDEVRQSSNSKSDFHTWTCLEQAVSVDGIAACLSLEKVQLEDLIPGQTYHLKERIQMALLRLLLAGDDAAYFFLRSHESILPDFGMDHSFLGFDVKLEFQLLTAIRSHTSDSIDQAIVNEINEILQAD